MFFFVRKVLIPLKSEQDGPGLRFGSDTRDCLNLNLALANLKSPAAAYFSIGWLYVATLQDPSRASKPSLATAKSKLRPGPATAWLERVAAQGRRWTFDTSDQVRLH